MRRLILLLALAFVAAACSATGDVVADVSDPIAATPTGRAALAATQGEPHVLWFWGAH